MSLTDRLLFDSSGNLDIFNPYETPPNIQQAEDHNSATRVGLTIEEDESIKQCPCCRNPIQKVSVDVYCPDDQLLFLGVGYPLFFKLFRYFGFIIFVVFLASGSGFYLLNTLTCKLNCVYFQQIPILDLENSEGTSFFFDIVHLATSILILAVTILVKIRIQSEVVFLQSKSMSPQQYTIIVQNLPEELNEEQISEWSKEKFGVKPIVINFAYNLSQLQDAFEQRLVLTIRMNSMVIKRKELEKQRDETMKNLLSEYIKDTEDKIRKYDLIIDHYKHENVNCRKIGTVFLTYSDQKFVMDILNKHQSSFLSTVLHRSLPFLVSQGVKYSKVPVVIHKAPAPREIIWQNLSFSYPRYVLTEVLALGTMVFVLMVAFKIQLYFAELEYQYRLQNQDWVGENNFFMDFIESFSLSAMIMLVNLLLRFIIKSFISIKRHYSYSRYQSSFCFYYSIMYIFNTCFMIYVIHMRHRPSVDPEPGNELPTIQRDHILLYDIHILMLINSLSDPIYKLIDPFMWFGILHRRYIASLPPELNPYPQAYVNELWEGHNISNVDNYQYIFRVLVVTIWFAHAAPLGVLISLLAYLGDYWLTKYLLVRWCKTPQTISKRVATPLIQSLPLIALVYLFGVLQYVYKVSDSHNLFAFIFKFLDYAVVILIAICVILAYYRLKPSLKLTADPTKYDEVQIAFESNYDTENPMNRIKSNVKYAAYRDLKRTALKSSSKIFNDIMALSRKESVSEKQSQLIKIKKKKLKKLQTIEIELRQEQGMKLRNHNSYREKSSSDSSVED